MRLQEFGVHLLDFQVVDVLDGVVTHIFQFVALVHCVLHLLRELLNRPFEGPNTHFKALLVGVGLLAVRFYFGEQTQSLLYKFLFLRHVLFDTPGDLLVLDLQSFSKGVQLGHVVALHSLDARQLKLSLVHVQF